MAYPIPKLSDAGDGTDVNNPYVNRNKNFQFNTLISNSVVKELSSFPCSEATLSNRTGQIVYIYDGSQGQTGVALEQHRAMQLNANDTMTFRGLTNSRELSAKTTSGTGTIYVRTAFASNLNSL